MERGDFVFYDRFLELCRRKGVVPTRAAVEAGISKSLVSKWKANEAKEPSPEVVRKLSEYFGVSPYEVLEDLPAGRGRPTLTERERRDVALLYLLGIIFTAYTCCKFFFASCKCGIAAL